MGLTPRLKDFFPRSVFLYTAAAEHYVMVGMPRPYSVRGVEEEFARVVEVVRRPTSPPRRAPPHCPSCSPLTVTTPGEGCQGIAGCVLSGFPSPVRAGMRGYRDGFTGEEDPLCQWPGQLLTAGYCSRGCVAVTAEAEWVGTP